MELSALNYLHFYRWSGIFLYGIKQWETVKLSGMTEVF